MALRIPVKTVTAGAIVGTAAVAIWMFAHAHDDPPRGDRGPLALPNVPVVDASSDAHAESARDGAVVGDASVVPEGGAE